jgi:hypothetical protein
MGGLTTLPPGLFNGVAAQAQTAGMTHDGGVAATGLNNEADAATGLIEFRKSNGVGLTIYAA